MCYIVDDGWLRTVHISVDIDMEKGVAMAKLSNQRSEQASTEISSLLHSSPTGDHDSEDPLPTRNTTYDAVNQSNQPVWHHEVSEHDPSLPEYHAVVPIPGQNSGWWKRLWAFTGPGAMVAVGYMDPGNWSTDIAGGSAFGYDLLFVILLSSLVGMFVQYLALKIGIATERDLAQVCRDAYPPYITTTLWIIMEIAICATG